jgi:hypothetical protein
MTIGPEIPLGVDDVTHLFLDQQPLGSCTI